MRDDRTATPVAISTALDSAADKSAPVVGGIPDAPTAEVVFTAAIVGVIASLMTSTATVAAIVLLHTPFPELKLVFETTAFTCLPLFVILGAVAKWWRALRTRNRSAIRWVGLSVPTFIILGAVGGMQFAEALTLNVETPPELLSRWVCGEALGSYGSPRDSNCRAAAAECQKRIRLASLWPLRVELRECVAAAHQRGF